MNMGMPTPLVFVIGAIRKLIGVWGTGISAVSDGGNIAVTVMSMSHIALVKHLHGGTQLKLAKSLQDKSATKTGG